MNYTAPEYLDGKKKVFEESFRSGFQKETKSDALQTLSSIRASHPASDGWVELDGYVDQLPNGKWIAVRHHAQYK